MFCWWKATWLKFYEFLPGPRIWPVKLASGVDEKTEVGSVPHQVGVADVVLDQTPTQDDHPCKGSKISLGKVTFLVMLLNGKEVPYAWTTLRICLYLCWHFSLQACWSVSSPQGCQPPSLNNNVKRDTKLYERAPGCLKEWKKSMSPRLPSVRAGEITGMSFLQWQDWR